MDSVDHRGCQEARNGLTEPNPSAGEEYLLYPRTSVVLETRSRERPASTAAAGGWMPSALRRVGRRDPWIRGSAVAREGARAAWGREAIPVTTDERGVGVFYQAGYYRSQRGTGRALESGRGHGRFVLGTDDRATALQLLMHRASTGRNGGRGSPHQPPSRRHGHFFLGTDSRVPGARVPVLTGEMFRQPSPASCRGTHALVLGKTDVPMPLTARSVGWLTRLGRCDIPMRCALGSHPGSEGGFSRWPSWSWAHPWRPS